MAHRLVPHARPACWASTGSSWPTSTPRSARAGTVGYEEARDIVRDALRRASARRIEQIADGLFAERRIDAEPRAGKRGGAFCASVAQDAQPYILMNFTDRVDDVMTLAHELGHGMHFTLARRAQTRPLVPHRPGAGRGAVDLRRVGGVRPPARGTSPTRPPAGCCSPSASRARSPRSSARRCCALRAARLRPARRGGTALTADRLSTIWFEENAKYYGDARRTARRLPAGLVVHPPLHPHPLLHLRLRVRAAGRAGALRAASARRAPRSSTGTSACWRPARATAPPTCCGPSESTSTIRACGTARSPSSSGWSMLLSRKQTSERASNRSPI